jgi:hypothetical protein
MKKMILVLAIGILTGAMAYADDGDTGALGLGIMTDSSNNGLVGGGIRGSLYLDAGTQLYGPFHYGFELQGDLKRLSQDSSYFSASSVSAYYFDNTQVIFIENHNYKQTYTMWDADISPRAYLSFDLGNKIQILGFAGLNYNWQTLDYELSTDSGDLSGVDPSLTGDSTYKQSTTFGGMWAVVMGFRASLGAFYVDYTRFLQANNSGNYAWNQYNKDRLSGGISLRF